MFGTAKALIFGNPWVILGIVAALAASHGYAIYYGKSLERGKAAKVRLAAERKYQADYQKSIARGNDYAKQLAERETVIVYRTKEVIRNVPQVTTGKPCLSDAALRMLNYRPGNAAVPEAPSKPIAEDATALAATDTDVAYFISDANGQYETCAARLNTLIDYFGD